MTDTLITLIENCWIVLLDLGVWLLVGAAVAGAMQVMLPADFIKRQLGGGGHVGVLKSVLLGVPMPLCSCGVIPAGIGLKKQGASDGAATGFLIATPQTGVDSILVSASFLGWPFAIFKLAAAFVTGWIGGVLVDHTGRDHAAEKQDANADAAPPKAEVADAPAAGRPRSVGDTLRGIWHYGVDDLLYMIWRWVLFGVVVSALISTFIPTGELADTLLGREWIAIPLILIVSIPLYVCATSSVPIAGALVAAGMPAGAALVFLMAGPATNVATIGSVYRAFGKRVLALYLSTIVIGSVALGYAFQFVLGAPGEATATDPHAHHGGDNPIWHGVMVVAAIVLLLLIVKFAIQDLRVWLDSRRAAVATVGATDDMTLQVAGMTCQGCVKRVTTTLQAMPGVASVDVSLDDGTAHVTGSELNHDALCDAVKQAGFSCG